MTQRSGDAEKAAKLNREVAIKVLPPAFAEDSARMQRFEREGLVLAALIELDAIVMELMVGAGPSHRDGELGLRLAKEGGSFLLIRRVGVGAEGAVGPPDPEKLLYGMRVYELQPAEADRRGVRVRPVRPRGGALTDHFAERGLALGVLSAFRSPRAY